MDARAGGGRRRAAGRYCQPGSGNGSASRYGWRSRAAAPSPEATPTSDAPPPYDVGSIQPTAPVSDQPLTALIASTSGQPALNASLRITEEGRKALANSKPDDAIRDLGRAISVDPTDPYAYFFLGRAYMMKKDYQQALAFFGRSEVGLRTVPVWLGEVKSFEGACLEEQEKFSAAAAAYKQALDAAPGNLMARIGYGRLSENLSDANASGATPPPPPLTERRSLRRTSIVRARSVRSAAGDGRAGRVGFGADSALTRMPIRRPIRMPLQTKTRARTQTIALTVRTTALARARKAINEPPLDRG